MARSKKPAKQRPPAGTARGAAPRRPRREARVPWLLAGVMLFTLVPYLGAFDNTFVDWDDPDYVEQNPLVLGHDYRTLATAVVSNNWHPLTMFSLAMNASQPLSARPFLATNVALHALNAGLVFWLVFLLSGRRPGASACVALLFGVHPMHVESVAWVSERKDVLYTFFFLAGLIAYWRHLERPSWRWLALTFALFLLSCLAKAMAVVFPLAMILLDWWKRRPLVTPRALAEKASFFAASLLFGLIALDVQSGGTFHGLLTRADTHLKGIADSLPYAPIQRLSFGTYGYMMYVVKLFAPVDLSALYPYPKPPEANDLRYLLSPLFLAATIAAAMVAARRARYVTFGIAWYVVTIVTVLQWVPVGEAIMADRYTYLPYVGLFFALVIGVASLAERRRLIRAAAPWAVGALVGVFSWGTARQVEIWKDSESLWGNVVRLYPASEMAYIARGNYRGRAGNLEGALSDLQAARGLGSRKGSMYDGLGNAYGSMGKIDSALVMFDMGLQVEPGMGRTHYNRAIAYLRLGRPREALADLARAEELMPALAPTLHFPRGNAYLQLARYQDARAAYDRAIAVGVRDPYAYYNRAIARMNLGDRAGAAQDFEEAKRLNPALAAPATGGR